MKVERLEVRQVGLPTDMQVICRRYAGDLHYAGAGESMHWQCSVERDSPLMFFGLGLVFAAPHVICI